MLGKPFNITVPNARLWSLDDPYLYTLNVSLYASTPTDKSEKAVTSFQAQASHMQHLAAERFVSCACMTCGSHMDKEYHTFLSLSGYLEPSIVLPECKKLLHYL